MVITAYNIRLFDKDNIYVKAICDQLRYHAIIPDDDPDSIDLSWSQVKVKTKKEIRTEILVDIIPRNNKEMIEQVQEELTR